MSWSGAWLDYYLNHFRGRKSEEYKRERDLTRLEKGKYSKHPLRIDVLEDQVTYKVSIELPETEKHDIDVKVSSSVLKISANIHRGTKSYHQKLPFPFKIDIDTVRATYTDGILEIIFLRKKQPIKERSVTID